MKYKIFGNTGLRVSELCLGTMTFGDDWGWGAPVDVCKQLVEEYLASGGNFIDTANYYTNGSSERILGDILKSNRQEIVLATKYSLLTNPKDINSGGNHRKNMIQALEQSLKRLKTDYIDIFWVHIIDEHTPIEETMRALDDLVRSGKVLYLGISDTPAWIVARANAIAEMRGWTRFSAMQAEYSLIERTSERDLLPMAKSEKLSVMAWSPLSGGLLTGKYNAQTQIEEGSRLAKSERLNDYNLAIAETVIEIGKQVGASPAQVALAWVRRHDNVIPILGSRKLAQLQDNLDCVNVNLTTEHFSRLEEVSKIDLGFPHEFIARKGVQDIIYGTFDIEN